jgi:hypothetical protein
MARKQSRYIIYEKQEGDDAPKRISFDTARRAWLWRINFPCTPMSEDIPEYADSGPNGITLAPLYHVILCPRPTDSPRVTPPTSHALAAD